MISVDCSFQAVQDDLQGMEQQLQSVSKVVSNLRLYLTDSAADELDHKVRHLTEQLHDLDRETTQIADEIDRAQRSSSELHDQLAEFDSRLQSADQRVTEMNHVYAEELTVEDTAIVVSCLVSYIALTSLVGLSVGSFDT